jgi:hypothetical protein
MDETKLELVCAADIDVWIQIRPGMKILDEIEDKGVTVAFKEFFKFPDSNREPVVWVDEDDTPHYCGPIIVRGPDVPNP